MEYVLLVLQLALGVALFLLWSWLKGLPAAIHKRQEQLFQQQFTRELELLKITQSQIQVQKVERFINFAKLQTNILANEEFKTQIQNNDTDAIAVEDTEYQMQPGFECDAVCVNGRYLLARDFVLYVSQPDRRLEIRCNGDSMFSKKNKYVSRVGGQRNLPWVRVRELAAG